MSASNDAREAAPGAAEYRLPLLALSAGAFMASATIRVGDPLIPQIARDFDVGVGTAAIVSTAFAFAYGICQPVHGPVGDRFGKFRVIVIGTFLSAIGTAAVALADSLLLLGLLRFAGGIASSTIIPLAMAYVGDVVPYAERQATLARFLTGQILGTVFGQVAGGVLGEFLHWRVIFIVFGALYVVAGLVLLLVLRRGIADRRGEVSLSPLAIARRYAALLARAHVRLVLAVVFLEGMLFYAGFSFYAAYLKDVFHLDYATIGLIVATFGLGGLAYVAVARRLLPRLGERGFAAWGGAILCVAFLAACVAPPYLPFIAVSIVTGLGFYLLHSTLQTNATQMAPEARGSAVSIFASSLFLGSACGIAVGGAMIDRIGYQAVFVASGAGLALLGLGFSRALGRGR